MKAPNGFHAEKEEHLNKDPELAPNWKLIDGDNSYPIGDMVAWSVNLDPKKIQLAAQGVQDEYHRRLDQALAAIRSGELPTARGQQKHPM